MWYFYSESFEMKLGHIFYSCVASTKFGAHEGMARMRVPSTLQLLNITVPNHRVRSKTRHQKPLSLQNYDVLTSESFRKHNLGHGKNRCSAVEK